MIELLKQVPIFQNFSDDDLEYLKKISVIKKFEKGRIIFFKGDDSVYLHVLLQGSLKIYKNNIKGNEIVLKILHKSSLVAELANLEHIPYPSNCASITDSKVLLIDFKKFEKYFLNNPKFLLMFVKSLTKTILMLENTISFNLTLDSTSKVAKHILETLSSKPNMNHKITASILNMTPETYSRVIRKFKNENLIKEEEGQIEILNEKKLKNYFDI
ncbi:MAG: Crp/Fnr family transcriptional regulator [Campylobacteraceae bacterium]|nr:Crp/Fnr family transcriptional regulator [Campylobacteraceae bacterium]